MTDFACPACGSPDHDDVETWPVAAQHVAYAGGNAQAALRLDSNFGSPLAAYRMQRCRRCALERAEPLRAPPPAWYAELYAQLALYPAQRWEYGVVAAALASTQTVVDYGCGSGAFLAGVRHRVHQAIGVDFAEASVAAARERGLDARRLDLDAPGANAALPAVDHITAFHVLEHLAQPATLFDFAHRVGTANARLWIAVPSDRRASRVYREADVLDAPPHHLTRWSEVALREIGRHHGWHLQRHLYEPLPLRLALWEATRRHPLFSRLGSDRGAASRLARRALALGVWLRQGHRRPAASGFSMLGCFSRAR